LFDSGKIPVHRARSAAAAKTILRFPAEPALCDTIAKNPSHARVNPIAGSMTLGMYAGRLQDSRPLFQFELQFLIEVIELLAGMLLVRLQIERSRCRNAFEFAKIWRGERHLYSMSTVIFE